jgi:hypothetical protein
LNRLGHFPGKYPENTAVVHVIGKGVGIIGVSWKQRRITDEKAGIDT